MNYSIENQELRITADTHGAELMSIYDKTHSREVLWQGDPAYWSRRAPILFPNVGRHYNNQYRLNGKIYSSSQHGFARDREFTLLSSSETELTFILHSDEETLIQYPFPFTLCVRYSLQKRELTVTWNVTNLSDQTMYFTIGGHPAFQVPINSTEQQSDYSIQITPPTDSLMIERIDMQNGCVKSDGTFPLSLKDGGFSLTDHLFDQDALILDHGQVQSATILHPDHTPYIRLQCEGFPNFGIWSKPGAPFICLEPWMGRTDDNGYTGELKDKENMNALNPGEQFHQKYCITIY